MRPLWEEGMVSYYQIRSLGFFLIADFYTKHQDKIKKMVWVLRAVLGKRNSSFSKSLKKRKRSK